MPWACRPGTAAAASVVVGLATFAAWRGILRTPGEESLGGGDRPLLGPRVRGWYRGLVMPFEEALAAWGVAPDTITYAQLAVSILAGAAFWAGAIFLAGWLVILAGTFDILDGGVARRTGVASAQGALVDSLVDRYAEFTTFFGLGAFFREEGWMLAVVAVAAFGSLMVSYTRARAEGLGLALREGHAQRPERYVLLGFGAWLSALVAHLSCPLLGHPTQPPHVVLEAAVVLLAVLATWTAMRRAGSAARALGRT